jgi:hypothetical protein
MANVLIAMWVKKPISASTTIPAVRIADFRLKKPVQRTGGNSPETLDGFGRKQK